MAVVDGVVLVVAASLRVLQDGDSYSTLLDIAHRLHGEINVVLLYLKKKRTHSYLIFTS